MDPIALGVEQPEWQEVTRAASQFEKDNQAREERLSLKIGELKLHERKPVWYPHIHTNIILGIIIMTIITVTSFLYWRRCKAQLRKRSSQAIIQEDIPLEVRESADEDD